LSPNSSFQLAQLALDDGDDAARLGEDVEQIGDGRHDLAVLLANLVLLEARKAAQLQIDDRLLACSSERWLAVLFQPELLPQTVLAGNWAAGALPHHLLNQVGIPGTGHQALLRLGGDWAPSL